MESPTPIPARPRWPRSISLLQEHVSREAALSTAIVRRESSVTSPSEHAPRQAHVWRFHSSVRPCSLRFVVVTEIHIRMPVSPRRTASALTSPGSALELSVLQCRYRELNRSGECAFESRSPRSNHPPILVGLAAPRQSLLQRVDRATRLPMGCQELADD